MRSVGLSLAVVAALSMGSATAVADAVEPAVRPAAAGHDSIAGWGQPQQVNPDGALTSISCSSPKFCAAVGVHGYALTYDGDTWSAPQSIDRRDVFVDVSCISAAFCVAADSGVGPGKEGDVFTYRGAEWSAPTEVGGWLGAVSCTSRVFCVAINVYPDQAYTYDGSSWAQEVDLPTSADAVSCASESMCVAVGDRRATVFDGTEWRATTIVPHIPRFVRLASVSCVTTDFCVTVDDTGQAYTYDGTGWSKPTAVIPMRPRTGTASVSCGAVGMCVMVTSQGRSAALTGDRWSKPERIDSDAHHNVTSVSCSGPRFCTAVDRSGYAIVYRP